MHKRWIWFATVELEKNLRDKHNLESYSPIEMFQINSEILNYFFNRAFYPSRMHHLQHIQWFKQILGHKGRQQMR